MDSYKRARENSYGWASFEQPASKINRALPPPPPAPPAFADPSGRSSSAGGRYINEENRRFDSRTTYSQSQFAPVGLVGQGSSCFDHQKGYCDRGSSCRFSHDGVTGGGGGGGGGGRGGGGGGGVCFDHQKGYCDRGHLFDAWRATANARKFRFSGTHGTAANIVLSFSTLNP
jgi:hypothetical protein